MRVVRMYSILGLLGAVVACGSGPTFPIVAVTGQNGDAVFADGERTADFDLEADSYAVRWTTAKTKPCAASLILHNAGSEKQTPIEFELTPTQSSSGAYNLTLGSSGTDVKGKFYLTAQVGRDCGDGAWKVTFTPTNNVGSTTDVVATPPNQAAIASAYHRVVDPDVESIVSDIQAFQGCTDSPQRCVIDFFSALGQHADKALNDLGQPIPHAGVASLPNPPLDVPHCLDAANSELVAALDAFSQSSNQIASDVSTGDAAAVQADEKLYGVGIDHFKSARSLLSQASCSA
jgi:hypothetical protein